MISIVMPSRGLIHSRTVEHVLVNSKGYDVEYLISHDLPIPDCFNSLIDKATGEYVWFVEEDMGFPDDTLDIMLETIGNYDAVTIDYPVADGVSSLRVINGILTSGMGCLLIRSEAMKDIYPLRTDIAYDGNTLEPLDVPAEYGGQDIYLLRELHIRGYKVGVLPFKAWHYKLVSSGASQTNKGAHTIIKRG